jgi:hypothetical protein
MEKSGFWGIASLVLSLLSNGFTVAASAIALYLFIWKKKPISDALKALLNYSFNISLAELRAKLERLNDLTTNDSAEKEKIVNILCDILGQIKGNKRLRTEFPALLKTLTNLTNNPEKLNEPLKRSLVAELRESLNSISISDYSGG